MYTKGEWKVRKNEHPKSRFDFEYEIIVESGTGKSHYPIAETKNGKANAHLIAAAPELYEALKYARAELLEFIEDNYGDTDLFEIHFKQLHPIDEALAKVEVK